MSKIENKLQKVLKSFLENALDNFREYQCLVQAYLFSRITMISVIISSFLGCCARSIVLIATFRCVSLSIAVKTVPDAPEPIFLMILNLCLGSPGLTICLILSITSSSERGFICCSFFLLNWVPVSSSSFICNPLRFCASLFVLSLNNNKSELTKLSFLPYCVMLSIKEGSSISLISWSMVSCVAINFAAFFFIE